MPIISSFSNKAFGGSRILSSNSALNPQYTTSVDYILVAGGGGGASIGGGGGGGGKVQLGSGYPVTRGTVLSIGIGGGGGGSGGSGGQGGDGGSSTLTGPGTPSISVNGGGGGGTPNGKGRDGGSGGGGGRDNTQPDINNRGFATGGQTGGPTWGKNGGRGAPANPTQPANFSGAGGGGGANATGGDGSNNSPNGADERGGGGGNGISINELFSSYNTNYRPPMTKPYPNAPTHPVYAPLGITSDIFAAGGGGGISGAGQKGGNGGSSGGGSGYPQTGGDAGNGPGPQGVIRAANSAVQFSGAGGGGGGTGPGDPWRDGGSGAGGRCIIRWNAEQFANATSTSGTVYFHEANGYRHFDFTGSGSLTI